MILIELFFITDHFIVEVFIDGIGKSFGRVYDKATDIREDSELFEDALRLGTNPHVSDILRSLRDELIIVCNDGNMAIFNKTR